MRTTRNILKRQHGLNRCSLCEDDMIKDNIDKKLNEAKFIAVEAMFELDPFDREAQKDFEDNLDKLSMEYYSVSV